MLSHLLIYLPIHCTTMSSSTHLPSGPASFQTLSTIPIDLNSSGLARWLAQLPREESWNAIHLREKQPKANMLAGLKTGVRAPAGTSRDTCRPERDGGEENE